MLTQSFNASRGSILLPVLMHFQLIHPLWPDAQPYETPVFVAAAFLVVCLNRKDMLGRASDVTEVLPGHRRRP
jgi:hypothetical protein